MEKHNKDINAHVDLALDYIIEEFDNILSNIEKLKIGIHKKDNPYEDLSKICENCDKCINKSSQMKDFFMHFFDTDFCDAKEYIEFHDIGFYLPDEYDSAFISYN